MLRTPTLDSGVRGHPRAHGGRAERHRRGRRRPRPAADARGRAGADPRSTATPPTSTPRSLRGLYRDMVLVRRFDAEATALQRRASSASGPAARPGGRADRRRPRAAPQDMASRPTASTASPGAGASTPPSCSGMFRGTDHGGWDPNGQQLPPVHDRHRQPVPATPPATRWASGSRPGRRRRATPTADLSLLRRRRHQPGRRRTRRSCSPPSTTRPWSSSARTTSGRSPSPPSGRPGCRSTSARRATASPASGSTATTCSPAWPSPAGRWSGPAAATGPTLVEAFTYRMGAHTTSDDPTRYRLGRRAGGCGSSRTRSSGCGSTWSATARADEAFFARGRRPRPTTLASAVREFCVQHARPRADRMFSSVYARGPPAGRRAARGSSSPTTRRSSRGDPFRARAGEAACDDVLTSPRRSTTACARRWRRDPKVLIMGEDVGKLGGVFRVTDGLQKDFGEDRVHRHPAGRVRHRRHRRSAWRCAATGRSCEIQFDGFVFPAFDQIVTQLAKMHVRVAGQGQDAGRHPHPVRRRHRRGRAPQRVARGAVRAHRRAEGRRLLEPRPTPTG